MTNIPFLLIAAHKEGKVTDVLGDRQSNPSLGRVQYADDMDDIIKWIENRTSKRTSTAVLVPTNNFVLIRCGDGNGDDVILMGHCLSGNKKSESLKAKTMHEALESLHPDHWFERLTVGSFVSYKACPAFMLSSEFCDRSLNIV
jgi:hypothetical protein